MFWSELLATIHRILQLLTASVLLATAARPSQSVLRSATIRQTESSLCIKKFAVAKVGHLNCRSLVSASAQPY